MQKALRIKLLMTGILMLSFGYGYYTTLARIVGGSAEATSKVALAELASSAPALLWGIMADRYGAKRVAAAGLLASVVAITGLKPIDVFLTLSFFYAPFLVSLLQASAYGSEVIGEAVAILSLGWGLGIIALEVFRDNYMLLSMSFALGSLLVVIGSTDLKSEFKPWEVILKLKPLVLPLSLFIGAEYLAYALTALRFYEISPSVFVLTYAILPSLTSFVCGYCAGKVVSSYGAGKVLLLSMSLYPFIVLLALVAPPPWCLISWSIPIYPFYETALITLVTTVAKVSEGSALGFTYALMALSSFTVFPLTSLNNFKIIATVIVVLMTLSVILLRGSLKKLNPPS